MDKNNRIGKNLLLPIERIRNFSIIAHIDHGKSTLADRLMEICGAISKSDNAKQVLDDMDLEQERGITIKARAVSLSYLASDNQVYELNLIDTPGHVDFTYEVSRSLAACEGALLIIDASQGVEAQTIANAYLAIENDLEIIPVLNKIDLQSAEPERVKQQAENVLGLDMAKTVLISAKSGAGIDDVMEAIVKNLPPPKGDRNGKLKGLVFDSWYDNYRGVIILVRIFDGKVCVGDKIEMFSTGKSYDVLEVGLFTPGLKPVNSLVAGNVGYVVSNIRNVHDTKVGDTITHANARCDVPMPGYKEVKPMVYCGIFPINGEQYKDLKTGLDKLQLNDSSFRYEAENSLALGFGFRCGFLGLLHMEIIKERLEREYGLDLICTAPTVVYLVYDVKGQVHRVDNPAKLDDVGRYDKVEEPFYRATIMLPNEFIGAVLQLCEERRGRQVEMTSLEMERTMLVYELPLNEIVFDFFDRLKSVTKGYASLDYEFHGYRQAQLVKVDILINGENVDALSFICHNVKAYSMGKEIISRMKDLIPRQLYEVAIQAAIGNKVIARETVKALRKNVTAKCYGGDITRKRKLWNKQKEGKKKMKQVGRVSIPSNAFLAILRTGK